LRIPRFSPGLVPRFAEPPPNLCRLPEFSRVHIILSEKHLYFSLLTHCIS